MLSPSTKTILCKSHRDFLVLTSRNVAASSSSLVCGSMLCGTGWRWKQIHSQTFDKGVWGVKGLKAKKQYSSCCETREQTRLREECDSFSWKYPFTQHIFWLPEADINILLLHCIASTFPTDSPFKYIVSFQQWEMRNTYYSSWFWC